MAVHVTIALPMLRAAVHLPHLQLTVPDCVCGRHGDAEPDSHACKHEGNQLRGMSGAALCHSPWNMPQPALCCSV